MTIYETYENYMTWKEIKERAYDNWGMAIDDEDRDGARFYEGEYNNARENQQYFMKQYFEKIVKRYNDGLIDIDDFMAYYEGMVETF